MAVVKIIKMLGTAIFSSFLVGCWMGDYVPETEHTVVARTNAGLCFKIPDADDYQPYYLSIKDIDAKKENEFVKMMPALKISDDQLCIPDSYYPFPENGNMYVDLAFESPSKVNQRRFVVAEFKLVGGEPYTSNANAKKAL